LSVASSGQVIPAPDVERLFQPFRRFGPRPARHDGGHGLGLSIVRAIATAHAATVTARPRQGGGLTIDVTFPSPQGRRPHVRRDGPRRTVAPLPEDAGDSALLNGRREGLRHTRREAR
jgi:hypothetical protein